MPVIAAVALVLVLALVFGPSWWIRHVLKTHGIDRPDLPGTGGEFARHLLDEARLEHVKVEMTNEGDHYDPMTHTVRLLPHHHEGRSVAAVAIAAHEVSHAIQHARGERAFTLRLDLVSNLVWIDRIAAGILVLVPVMFMLVKSPALAIVQVGAAIALFGVRVVVHLVTLPVEFDASFGKALPVLEGRGYLSDRDMPTARSVLRAAAFTYVAAALATLLNVLRWFRIG